MSNQFSNPATYGDYKISSFSKEMKLDSFPNSILVAPFDGVVVPNKKRNCKNGISIKHNFNNEVLYSNFCDVGVSFISVGDYVRQNTTIGQFGSEQIIYSVENANGDKININDLMKGATVRKSEERTTRPVKSNQIKKKEKQKDYEGTPNPFMDLLLSPLSIAKDVFGKKSLKEELERIKKLM